jgi:hypothetical protein
MADAPRRYVHVVTALPKGQHAHVHRTAELLDAQVGDEVLLTEGRDGADRLATIAGFENHDGEAMVLLHFDRYH